jgi:NADH-quinone oxidoreductase subunit D
MGAGRWQSVRRSRSMLLNFGPQHPAAHGLVKVSLALEGDIIVRADPHFGLLHRGSEKLCEGRSLLQALPYLDRMDYVANLFQEHAFVSAVEQLGGSHRLPSTIALTRLILDELSRVLNHLMTLSAVCLDLGAMGPIFWAFEERESIMEFFERLSGARMHTAVYRPFTLGGGGEAWIAQALPDLVFLIQRGARFTSGAFLGLLSNRALRARLSGIGQFSPSKISCYGVTGVIARSAGVAVDKRLGRGSGYGGYGYVTFRSFCGRRGDNYDRFILRAKEVLECLRLVSQGLSRCEEGASARPRSKFVSMEALIGHFHESMGAGWAVRGLSYGAVEGPKGEVGVLLVSPGSTHPHRVQIRSPVAHNLHLVASGAMGVTFADFVATFCSLDVVLGEIDR